MVAVGKLSPDQLILFGAEARRWTLNVQVKNAQKNGDFAYSKERLITRVRGLGLRGSAEGVFIGSKSAILNDAHPFDCYR